MKTLILAAVAAFALSGCASLGTPVQQSLEQVAIEYATLKVVDSGNNTTARQARASQILSVATQAKSAFSDPQATLATVTALVATKIATLNLKPEDQLVAQALMQAVSAELSAKVGAGVLNPDQVTSVNTVLGWVITAASMPVS